MYGPAATSDSMTRAETSGLEADSSSNSFGRLFSQGRRRWENTRELIQKDHIIP